MKFKFSIRALIWFSVAMALLVAAAMAMIPKPVDVEAAQVTEGPLRVFVQEDGKTRIREKYIVSAPVAGRLTRIDLHPGDPVQANETLLAVILPSDPAILDARARAQAESRVKAASAALKRSESSFANAEINLDHAKNRFERVQQLNKQRSVSRDEYDTAEADFLARQQAVKTARFETEIAQFELEMARAAANQFDTQTESAGEPFEIRSPVKGRVLRVFQESSTVVNSGVPLLELGDPRNLEIEVDVLSTDAVRIQPGAELTIQHWGGQTDLKGIVRVIEPAAFTKVSSLGVEEQRVNVIADFDESPERLAALGDGYRVEARITVEEANQVLKVPSSALFRHQREWHVFVIHQDKAQMIPVEVGIRNEAWSEITSGLRKGLQVILYPNDQIQPGQLVRVID